jgi:hypothetical protein
VVGGRRSVPAPALLLSATLLAASASAQAPLPRLFTLPWQDVAPHVEDGDRLVVAAVGVPDPRIARFTARRDGARVHGRERALAMLRGHLERVLEAQGAPEATRARLPRALRRLSRIRGVRALVDGGAVVVLEVSLTRVRAAVQDPPLDEEG